MSNLIKTVLILFGIALATPMVIGGFDFLYTGQSHLFNIDQVIGSLTATFVYGVLIILTWMIMEL